MLGIYVAIWALPWLQEMGVAVVPGSGRGQLGFWLVGLRNILFIRITKSYLALPVSAAIFSDPHHIVAVLSQVLRKVAASVGG
jgi:hypothetical protein